MDPNLRLKPIELLDIGIDKHTKIPIPILNNNVISTFNMDNGVPVDSFIFTFDSTYSNKGVSATISSTYNIILSFNWGDGSAVDNWTITSGGTSVSHIYTSATTYTITAYGWLEKINSLIILPSGSTYGGITAANILALKKLTNLNLSNNRLTKLSLDGMIYLNNISLDNNYLTNDVIDDLYIEADTFLTFNGNMSTLGTTNGKPSIYSDFARNSLTSYKGWTLNYNT